MSLITIITICRNNPEELDRTLASIDWSIASLIEVLVIDGSDNGNMCFDISQQYSVTYSRQTGKGIYNAMNLGVQLTSDRSISTIFMNSGDQFHADFNLGKFLRQHEKILSSKIVFGNTIRYYQDIFQVLKFDESEINHFGWWLKKLPSHQSVFCPTRFLKANKFDESLFFSADSKLLIEAFSQLKILYVDEYINLFELGGVSNKPSSILKVIKHTKEYQSVYKLCKLKRFSMLLKHFIKLVLIRLIGFKNYLLVMGFEKKN